MDAKLTLKLDKLVIDKAKEYAATHKRSLSRIIEAYLKSLTSQNMPNIGDDFEISPFVKSISTGVKIPKDLDYKSDYLEHMNEKFK